MKRPWRAVALACPVAVGLASALPAAAYEPAPIGKIVRIRELPDIRAPHAGHPTTAELGSRDEHPDPDRVLPGGVRIHTVCRPWWSCVDVLSVGRQVLVPRRPLANERVIRVAFQDSSFISVYVAESSYEGGAHTNNMLRCRTFDLATGKALALGDVLPGDRAARALSRARRLLRSDEAEMQALTLFGLSAKGFRFQPRKHGGRDVVLCAEGFYPSRSDEILELVVR